MSIKISRHAESWSRGTKTKTKREEEEGERLEDGLTDSDCSHHWRHNNRECHSTSDHQVPLMVGNIFAFIAVMDLQQKGSNVSHSVI